jgi:hypothetical protein
MLKFANIKIEPTIALDEVSEASELSVFERGSKNLEPEIDRHN